MTDERPTTTHASISGASDWILRRARVAHVGPDTVDLDVDALPAIELAGTPGWLTGEPLIDQGVEMSMPNLPTDLPLPDADVRPFRCRVEIVGPAAVRIVVAPAGARVFTEQPTWLGIVTEPTIGSTSGSIVVDDTQVVVETAECRLTIGLAPFTIEFGDPTTPTLRTAERLRQVAGFPMAPPVRFREHGSDAGQQRIIVNLELGSDEQILGFGEQFSRVVKNGQQLLLRCEDALGTGTGLAYKPAPVWHSTRGYMGFINTGAEVAVDVGHVRPSVLSLDTADEALDLYLFGGSRPGRPTCGLYDAHRPGRPPAVVGVRVLDGSVPLSQQPRDARDRRRDARATTSPSMSSTSIPIGWWSTGSTPTSSGTPPDSANSTDSLPTWPNAAPGCRCGRCPTSTRSRLDTPRPKPPGSSHAPRRVRSPNCVAHRHPTAGTAACSTSPTPTRSTGGRRSTSRSSTRASPCSRPISARAAPTRSPPSMAPQRTTCTICTRCGTTLLSATPYVPVPAGRRSCGVEAAGPARTDTPDSGAATPSRPWPACRPRCAAVSHMRCRTPGSGAMTSAASSVRNSRRVSTFDGPSSALSRH